MFRRNIFKVTLFIFILFLGTGLGFPTAFAEEGKSSSKEVNRLDDARQVYQELLNIPDQKIPQKLLTNAKCIVIFPGVMKGALGWGGRHGHGVISCRDSEGHWSPPSFVTITGGSVGLQIGVEKDQIVLFFMTEDGARSLVRSKFTLGGKGSVAAGPVGRSAEADTDIQLNAEVYSYAKTKGLFAGISLEGARLASDNDAIARFYGKRVSAEQLLFQHKAPTNPPAAAQFTEALPH